MPRSSAPATDSPPLDANLRGLVSLGLFIHFFGVALALASYTAASPLQQRVLEVLPYLKWLQIDFTHAYPSPARLHQTHAAADDVDFTVRVTANLPDGKTVSETLPPADIWPDVRRRRYQSLANVMGSLVTAEDKKDFETALPKAFAASVLRPLGAKQGEIVITARNLPSMDDLGSTRAERNDPNNAAYFRKAYEAKLIVAKDTISLQKPSAAFEVAPVERGDKRSGPGQAPSPKGARP